MDSEHYHCFFCGKYIAPDDGWVGKPGDLGESRIYCDWPCQRDAEKDSAESEV